MVAMSRALKALSMRTIFESSDVLLNVDAVRVTMLLSVRNTWGGIAHRYDGERGFYVGPEAAKRHAERARVPGTSFRVHEVPGLRMDGNERSFVLLSLNERTPFALLSNESNRNRERFRLGLAASVAVVAASQVSYSNAEARGVVAVEVARSVELASLPSVICRSWTSAPSTPLDWQLNQEPDFEGSAASEIATLFARQSDKGELRRAQRELRTLGVPLAVDGRHLRLV
jgi:hypothetical protein